MNTTTVIPNTFNDFKHLDRHLFEPFSVGFDRVFDTLQNPSFNFNSSGGFPPYNIRKNSETSFVIEVALAGVGKDQIEVELKEGTLTVRSKESKKEETSGEFLHQGISYRKFTRQWTLADDIVVNGATMEDGMLLVQLERIIPEEKKHRLIKIK